MLRLSKNIATPMLDPSKIHFFGRSDTYPLTIFKSPSNKPKTENIYLLETKHISSHVIVPTQHQLLAHEVNFTTITLRLQTFKNNSMNTNKCVYALKLLVSSYFFLSQKKKKIYIFLTSTGLRLVSEHLLLWHQYQYSCLPLDFPLFQQGQCFLAVIEPMACSASSDDLQKLIGPNPNDLVNTLVTPRL